MNKSVIGVLAVVVIAVIAGVFILSSGEGSGPDTTNTSPSTSQETGTSNTSGEATEPTSQTYTLDDVAQHGKASDCYTAIDGNVYDLTDYISKHPGGFGIVELCGIDGTADFERQHGQTPEAKQQLSTLLIGELAN